MDPTGSCLAAVRRRVPLAGIVGIVGFVGTALFAACGNVILDGDAATSATGGVGGAGGAGGAGGVVSGGGSGGSGGAGGGPMCALTSTGTSGGKQQLTECFAPPLSGCPNQYDASLYITPHACSYLVSVDCGPIVQDGQCCYLATEEMHTCGGSG